MAGDGRHVLKDSGKRQDFDTGAVRDTREGKGRFDLLSPVAQRRLAQLMENGAVKYGDRNWEKGMPLSRYMDSAMRHVTQYLEGYRDEDHLIQAAWNLLAAVHVEEMVRRGLLPKELCDLPNYLPAPTARKKRQGRQGRKAASGCQYPARRADDAD